MVVNKITNFITRQIQWGQVKAGQEFFSEKQLAIKFNVSHSTAKNALIYAEAKGLLKSNKGKKRIALDFGENVFISAHLKIASQEIKFIRKSRKMMSDEELLIFQQHFKYQKLKKIMVLEIIYQQKKIASFFASTNNNDFYQAFFDESLLFTQLLQRSNLLIAKIDQTIFIEKQMVLVKRYLYDRHHYLIEESCLIVNPFFYKHQNKLKYHFSSKEL